MSEPKVDRISAYRDGELAPEEAAGVAARLAEDSDARALLESLARVDEQARAVFNAELEEPVSLALARSVRQGFAARRRRAIGRMALRWVGPMAAAVAIVIGGNQWIEHRIENALAEREARIAELTNAAVQQALESALSGVAVAVADEKLDGTVSITPIRTYRSESQHWCREFVERVMIAGEQVTRFGLACRENDGQWRRVQTRTPGYEPPPVGGRAL